MVFCLEGILGIITIDGNGKDGVDSIAKMINMLNIGFDYIKVQDIRRVELLKTPLF